MMSNRPTLPTARLCLFAALAVIVMTGRPPIAGAADAGATPPEGHRGDCTLCHGKQPANTYLLDAAKSLGVAEFRGAGAPVPVSIRGIRGGFTFDVTAPENSHVVVELNATTVQSTDGLVSDVVQSSQFLDSRKYPLIRFVSTVVTRKSQSGYEVSGKLTLHGATVPARLEVSFDGGGSDPLVTGKYAAFHASGSVRCRDFGIALCSASDTIQLDVFVVGRPSQ